MLHKSKSWILKRCFEPRVPLALPVHAVIPAQAGIQLRAQDIWIPACAGMTENATCPVYSDKFRNSCPERHWQSQWHPRKQGCVVSTLFFFLACCWPAAQAAESGTLVIDSVVLSPLQVAEVSAQQTGLVREIVAEEGAVVRIGDVLVRLDARQAELDLAKARIERDQAKAQANNRIKVQFAEKALEVAEAELRRSQESIDQFAKSISQSQLDVERLTVEKLGLERQQAEHEQNLDRFAQQLKEQELAAAELRLEQHAVLAPFAGSIVLVRGRVGEWVELGTPVARLVAVDKLRAEGFWAVEEIQGVLVDTEVRFHGQQQGLPIAKGRLRFISPEMDPVTRQVRVWAELENPTGKLRSGQQGRLEIVR